MLLKLAPCVLLDTHFYTSQDLTPEVGVGLLFKEGLEINTSICTAFQSFGVKDVRLRSLECVRMLVVYCPPDNTSYAFFYEEFSRLFKQIAAEHSGHILIIGDFNFHMDDRDNSHANHLTDILEAFDLKQYINVSTHKNGHTLDLIITRSDDSLIKRIKVRDPIISDYYAVHCDLVLQKPQFAKKTITYRKLRSINIETFCEDIQNSPLLLQQSPWRSLMLTANSSQISDQFQIWNWSQRWLRKL